MLKVALTGSISTGKTTVSNILKQEGAVIIDTDLITHSIYKYPGEVAEKLVDVFGPEIINGNLIDRKRLGSIVFNDPEKLKMLNSIVHPAVRKETAKAAEDFYNKEKATGKNYLMVFVIPLLFEVNNSYGADYIIVAACSKENQLRRLIVRDGFSEEEAVKRINTQIPVEEKLKRADFVINTDGPFKEIEIQVKELLKQWNWDKYYE